MKKPLIVKYSDIDYTGKDFIIYDEEVVFKKLELLLMSLEYNWFFKRDFNCDLRKLLFEEMTPQTIALLRIEIAKCLIKNIPEIIFKDVIVIKPDYEKRKYFLKIVFSLRDFPETFTFTKEIYAKQI